MPHNTALKIFASLGRVSKRLHTLKERQTPLARAEPKLRTMLLVQGVWASKYNERALLSMKKVGLDFNDLRMAVLVQRVVPADYAFVIHTHNPSNGSPDEIYAEVVKGLGESIVSGMVPGSSMAFVAKKSDLQHPEVCPCFWCTLIFSDCECC